MIVVLALLLLESHLDRAQSLLSQGKIAEAAEAADNAIRETPGSAPALTLRGRIAMAQDEFDLARKAFEKAAVLEPASPGVQFLLGFFYYVDNDFARGRPVLERARKLAPADPRTALFLALTLEGLAEPQPAEALFQETLRLQAASGRRTVEAHVAYTRMLFSQGRFVDAQKQVKAALALDVNSREALYEQARLDFEAARFSDSITHAERALTNQGDGVTDRQIHFLLSRAYSRAGDRQRAESHRRKFEAIPPRLIR